MLKKVKKKMITRNDVYFMEVNSNKIVINNNYKGIIVLNKDLEEIKQVDIFDRMMIYSCYINEYAETLLLFCAENECLVYVSLRDYAYKIIDLKLNFSDIVFSPVYLWNLNTLILSTYKGDFYEVDVQEGIITLISCNVVSEKHSVFYELWSEATKLNSVSTQSNYFQFIFKDDKGKYCLRDLLNNNTYKIDHVADMAHEITFEQDLFAFTSEECISIVQRNIEVDRIEIDNACVFLRTRFLKNTTSTRIVVLNGSKSDNCENLITVYDIEK